MMRITSKPIQLFRIAVGTALLAGPLLPAFAGDPAQEVSIAAQHAGYAADATIITTVHAHLHHTVNCLVGPNGKGFDAKELNPCQGKGNGAIPDNTDIAKQELLQGAVDKAEAGLASNDLATAKAEAAAAQVILKKAM